MAEIVLMAEEELRKRGKADAAELAAQVVAGGVTDQELLEQKTKVPTWRARNFSNIPAGTPYQFEGMIYKLVQPHDATGNPGWTPPTVPALWAAVSKPGESGTKEDPITGPHAGWNMCTENTIAIQRTASCTCASGSGRRRAARLYCSISPTS